MFDLVKNNILAELILFGWYSRPWSVLFSSPLVKLTLKSQLGKTTVQKDGD